MTRASTHTSALGLWRGFRSEKSDPETFYAALSDETVRRFPVDVSGQSILDLGCGPGWFCRGLERAGASVIGIDLDEDDVAKARTHGLAVAVADGRTLPFPDASFDGVFCSNMLEHTPDPAAILADAARVTKPGGWVWMSWTVWYGPWGGHAIAPFHYFGPRLGLKIRTRLMGPPTGKNLPFERLWPTHVGQVLKAVKAEPSLVLRDAYPRYWPSQRWILKVPGLREFLSWNCVLVLDVAAADPTVAAR